MPDKPMRSVIVCLDEKTCGRMTVVTGFHGHRGRAQWVRRIIQTARKRHRYAKMKPRR